MEFVHLHIHSHYSLLDGLPKIDELISEAKNLDFKALALTDHGVLYGAIEFYQKAKAASIKPIIGQEAYLAPTSYLSKRPKIDDKPYHIVLLVKNERGYKNLVKLTTQAHLKGYYYKPRIDFDLLKKYSEGLIVLTGCLQGEIPRLIISRQYQKLEKRIKEYLEVFGKENFYLEVQPHPKLPYQNQVNEYLIKLGRKLNINVVATNDVHYLKKEDAEAQDVLLCIQMKRKLAEKNRITYMGEDYSLKPAQKMYEAFKEYPEVVENSLKIAEECNLEFEFGKVILPHFKLPPQKTADEYLRELCEKGLKEKYKKDQYPKALKRLEYELKVIKKTGFAPYFLIVQDVINWAKERGIVVGPGRGSAAGSIVAYLTNITNVDPLRYDLLFERFLNPERISLPDIDIDFADERRDEVIRYVEQKYGKNHVAQIITFGTMAARAAVRDVGRVLGLSYSFCDRLAKLIPPFMKLKEALKVIPELKQLYQEDTSTKKLLDIAQKLEGVARHFSTHACGVVIGREPLTEYLPLQYAAQDDQTVITQYSLGPIEELGLLKMDFLGLKNLTIIENTLKIVEKTQNKKINIDQIPLDDKKTFKLLQEGKTVGVFQLESSGMRRYLKELKPNSLEDIIAMLALYRPGPMEWIPQFIARKHNLKAINYLHPKLKPILEKTYGVVVYQEQVMEIAQKLAGFTLGEADILRKAVGKKIPKLLKEQKQKFIKGCIQNKINSETAEKIFNFIEPFAGYGFNRAHATCYALISYQTAYLKANFPAEFMAALLTAEQNDLDRVALNVEEARSLNIPVLPPDINESFANFTVVKTKEGKTTIRFGLNAIKNVGANLVHEIIKERKEEGPFKNLEDFIRRIQLKDLNKKSWESLIKSGALDRFKERKVLLKNLDKILNYAKTIAHERRNGQVSLFGISPVVSGPSLKLEECPSASEKEKLAWEKEYLGLYISNHPLAKFKNFLKKYTFPINQLHQIKRTRVRIAGIITNIQRVLTRNQEPMLFVRLEDLSGGTEVLVFPTLLKKFPNLWQEEKILLIEGRLSNKEGEYKIICENAQELLEKK